MSFDMKYDPTYNNFLEKKVLVWLYFFSLWVLPHISENWSYCKKLEW